MTASSGLSVAGGGYSAEAEYDASGVNVGLAAPTATGGLFDAEMPTLIDSNGGVGGMRCTVDGLVMDCAVVGVLEGNGAAAQCPNNDCGPRSVTVTTTYASGQRVSHTELVNNPFFNVNARYTGAAARAAGEQFNMGMAEGGGGFGSALQWSLIAGEMLFGRPLGDSANHFAPQKASKSMPLSGATGELFTFERQRLLSFLDDPESDCAKFLKKTFDFNASRVARAVRSIRAFDADASTITMGAAGLLPYHDPETGKRNDNAKIPVNRYFETMRIYDRFITAKQAGYSMITMRDIYFSPMGDMITASLILHEALHMFTGMKDDALANRLGIKLENGDSTPITEALQKGGCGG